MLVISLWQNYHNFCIRAKGRGKNHEFTRRTSLFLHKFASDSPAQGRVSQDIDFRSITARKVVNLMARGAERTFLTLSSHPKLRNFCTVEDFATRRPRGCIIPVCMSANWLTAYNVYNTFDVGWLSCLSRSTGNAKALDGDKRESFPTSFLCPHGRVVMHASYQLKFMFYYKS